ncbi:hypothetical protein G6F57_015789 [Rhizopus arrhizus]|nr:hypothetical protein G6F57_015789 [Rhizopus arrhizus]
MHGTFAYRSLYFDVQAYPGVPAEPQILDVNPLLRELILRVTDWSADAGLTAAQSRIVDTLLDELAAAPTAPMPLPMPRDRRLVPIARELLANPSCPLSLEDWASRVGASSRTVERLFLTETGLPFARWRTQTRLLFARARLAEGMSVTAVAHAGPARFDAVRRLALVAAAHACGGALQPVDERVIRAVRTVGGQIGALGQVVGVAHAVGVHVGIAARQLVVGRGDVLPRGEDAVGTAHGQGRAQHVGVRLEAVHEAVGTELVAEGRAGGQVLADEPAVGGAAVGGGQLHDFQVIRHAQRVLARPRRSAGLARSAGRR